MWIAVCASCVRNPANQFPLPQTNSAASGAHATTIRSAAASAAKIDVPTRNLLLSSSRGAAASVLSVPNHLPTGVWQTIVYLTNPQQVLRANNAPTRASSLLHQRLQHGTAAMARLFRGVQAVAVGCIPAHALYFSSYEIVKEITTNAHESMSPLASSVAGACAVMSHDIIMTPLDTIKQRMQCK
jgi:Mitochondrial carrier protein